MSGRLSGGCHEWGSDGVSVEGPVESGAHGITQLGYEVMRCL